MPQLSARYALLQQLDLQLPFAADASSRHPTHSRLVSSFDVEIGLATPLWLLPVFWPVRLLVAGAASPARCAWRSVVLSYPPQPALHRISATPA